MPSMIKAWAVLTPEDGDWNMASRGKLEPFGNGNQWQYPIFPTRKEAQAWKDEAEYDRGRIVRVLVSMKSVNISPRLPR